MKQSSRARRTLSLSFCILLLLTLLTVFGGCGTAFDDTVYAIVSENNLSSDGFYYSLYENNTAVRRRIFTGAEFSDGTEIVKGASAGERIILDPENISLSRFVRIEE